MMPCTIKYNSHLKKTSNFKFHKSCVPNIHIKMYVYLKIPKTPRDGVFASKTTTMLFNHVEHALNDVIVDINEEPMKIWNSVELYSLYSTSLSKFKFGDSEGMEEVGSEENPNWYRCA